jgi:membrane protease YdiL (CAAX protease family)
MVAQRAADTLVNLVGLVVVPLLPYYVYHRRRHDLNLAEVLRRAGLQRGELKYVWHAVGAVAAICVWIWLFPPNLEVMTREGAAQHSFAGAGMSLDVISAALLYALVQTGFAEEFLFRGLIAGSLSRRMSVLKANLTQSVIFLAPHLLLLFIMPEQWPLLVFIYVGSLYLGWLRIRSGSILGPWLIHGGANLAMTLSVLVRTMSS